MDKDCTNNIFISLSETEQIIIQKALTILRETLLDNVTPDEGIDDLIIKISTAPTKKENKQK